MNKQGEKPRRFVAIADIVLGSYKIFGSFKKEFENFKKEKKSDFERINRLELDVYNLKNDTHYLFRDSIKNKKEATEADLYDLIVGSIFHEMLHLKEYIYILDKYEPSYLILEKRFEDKKIDDFKMNFLKRSREIVGEAKLGLPLKLQWINDLVDDALPHLEQIIKSNSFDSHLIRTLYVSSDILKNTYPNSGVDHLYDIIYDGGWIEGYFLVAESFVKSGFTSEAAQIFHKIIAKASVLSEKDSNYKLKHDYVERARIEIKNL